MEEEGCVAVQLGSEQQVQPHSSGRDTGEEQQLQMQSSSGDAGQGLLSQQQLLAPRSDTAPPPPAAATAAPRGETAQEQQGQQQQREQQQQGDLTLPVTYWHNDMLAGAWGSSLSVVSGGDQVSARSSTGSGISPSAVAPAEVVVAAGTSAAAMARPALMSVQNSS
jgi:hypothetical protein